MQLKDINIFDLAEMIDQAGGSYDPTARDEFTGCCQACQESCPQDADACPVCGAPVIWKNCQVWKVLYGTASRRINELTRPEPDEDDELGQQFLADAGMSGFANKTQKKRWEKARRRISEEKLVRMIARVKSKTERNGWLPYLLNWTDKTLREDRRVKKEQKRAKPTGTPRAPRSPEE